MNRSTLVPHPRATPRSLVAPILALVLSLALAACSVDGADPTSTAVVAPTATAVVAPSATAPPAVTATTVASNPPAATAAVVGTPARATTTPAAAATATPTVSPTPPAAGTRTPAATAAPATPSRAGGATAPRGTATPGRATPGTPAVARDPEPFTPTDEEPCRATDFERKPLPEQPATVETIDQAYHCLLLHYVDRQTLDHQVLLNGSWTAIGQAGRSLFAAADTAPLALTGDREADWAVYEERYSGLAAKYRRTVDPNLLAQVALEGMARSLNDNHVAYFEPKRWQRFFAESVGANTVIGPGFDIAIDEPSGKFYLHNVYPNTPAAQAGLRPGDIIEQVGGRATVVGNPSQGLIDLLTGPVGTQTTMRVTRPATGQTLDARVSVAEVEVPLIEARVLEGGIGYIKLRNFSTNAGEEFDRALADLQAQGIRALIFDVRQNPGGSVNAMVHIVSHFTHEGPLAITIDENGEREEELPDTDVPLLGLPFVVLADDGSASSSDITAAVAKGRGGHLVGQKSAGGLGGALLYELANGSALEITVVRVLGPDGEEINEIGVEPDHAIGLTPADLSAGNDPQLQHAIEDLAPR